MRTTVVALAGVLASLAIPVAAGTVCRSVGIAGYAAAQYRAERVLASATTRPDAIELYVERVDRGFYYESNYVANGARYTTKIFSETPMTALTVVQNLVYASRDEAVRDAADARDIVAHHLVVHDADGLMARATDAG